MTYKYFMGIDMAKSSFHCCIYQQHNKMASWQVDNNKQGLRKLEELLKDLKITNKDQALFCLEHTGIYNQNLLEWIVKKGYHLWLESPLAIKKSLGIQRGKSDPVDAQRIAQYAARFADQAQLWQPAREVIEELKGLVRVRERLLEAKNKLKTPLQESSMFLPAAKQKRLVSRCAGSLKHLERDIAQIEQEIQGLVASDEQLDQLYSVVQSVEGVGRIRALELIIVSNELEGIKTAKSCACYAGVAPFEYSSGSSIGGRSSVSPLANKGLKSLLHMGALSSVRLCGDLGKYYEGKVGEGKAKMLVLNALRNKLLQRVYACVRDMRLYSGHYVPWYRA